MPRRTQSQFKKQQQRFREREQQFKEKCSRQKRVTEKLQQKLQQKDVELERIRYLDHNRLVCVSKAKLNAICNNEKTQRWENRMKINKEIQSFKEQRSKKLRKIVCKHTQKNCYLAQKMYEKDNEIIKGQNKAKQFGEDMLNEVNELQSHFCSLFATAFKKSFNGQKKAVRSEINYLGEKIYKLQCKLTGKSPNRYRHDFLPKDNKLWKFSGDGCYFEYEKRVRKNSRMTYEATVPKGVYPGMKFAAILGGQHLVFICPANAVPGQKVRVQGPRPNITNKFNYENIM